MPVLARAAAVADQYGCTGVTGGAGHQSDHSTRILAVRKLRKANRIRYEIAVRHFGRGDAIINVETEIDQSEAAACV